MRTVTAGERTAVAGTLLDMYARLEIQDPQLAWLNVSTGLGAPDFFNAATISESIDTNTMSFSAELLRDTGSLSLAPLLMASTLNRDSGGNYAPMIDLWRKWRVSTAVVPRAQALVGGDWKEIGTGYLDQIDVGDSNYPTVQVTGRGMEAPIIDTEIIVKRKYSVGSASSMETVIQALLNDNMTSPPTLYVPFAMNFVINEYTQDYGSLMNALTSVAQLNGAVIRYVYDAANVNRLTLFIPNRAAAFEDWSIGSTEYLELPLNQLSLAGVRNYIVIRFLNKATGLNDVVYSPSTGTSTSISKYGKKTMSIDLATDTQITSTLRAQAMADAIRSDLETPVLQQQFETYGFWFAQLYDFGKILPNAVNY